MKQTFFALLVCLVHTGVWGQNNQIFRGGPGDGYSRDSVMEAMNNLWRGGPGDGYSRDSFLQAANNLWRGGPGDGYSRDSALEAANNLWRGGLGDGYSRDSALEAGNNLWRGGPGDGWGTFFLGNTVLPATLLSFTAEKRDAQSALISWQSSQETGLAVYVLERSGNGREFSFLNRQAASGGNGNHHYRHTDLQPIAGTNYYRLRMVDRDGSEKLSPVQMVLFGQQQLKLTISPNPATTRAILQMQFAAVAGNKPVTVNIVSASGMLMMQRVANTAQLQAGMALPTGQLAKGSYYVQVLGDGIQQTITLLVQ